jgi:hypothetical protein
MDDGVSSILLGTSGLTLVAAVSLVLTVRRGAVALEHVSRIRQIAGLGVLFQSVHFAEEATYRFYIRFPELLGLSPWTRDFFAAFNLTWLAVWVVALAGIDKLPRVCVFPLWLLAIASAANGAIHPLLSLAVAGYFPGLWSSVFVGIVGVMLIRVLVAATGARADAHGVSCQAGGNRTAR